MFVLRTVGLSLTQLEVFTWKQHVSFKMAQVQPCSGIRRSMSCLFWSTTPAKLCWLFKAILGKFIPSNLILGCSLEWHSFVVLNRYLRSPRAHRWIVSSSVFFHGLTHRVVNPGVTSWYLDCGGGRKYYRVGNLPCGLELSLWGPIFPDFNQDLNPWSIQWQLFRIFWVLVDTPQVYILLELPNGHGIRPEDLSLWIQEKVIDINKRSPIQHLLRTKTNLFLRGNMGVEESDLLVNPPFITGRSPGLSLFITDFKNWLALSTFPED